MSTVTRRRTPVPTAPEWRARHAAPRPSAPKDPRRQSQVRRRRAALAGGFLPALIAVVAVLVLSGSGTVPPATGAAEVVPSDVLAYVHVSIDSGRPAVRQARALARRFPDYPLAYAAAINRLSAIVAGGSSATDFETGIRPWLGRESAFAVLDTASGSAPSLIVLDVSSRGRA